MPEPKDEKDEKDEKADKGKDKKPEPKMKVMLSGPHKGEPIEKLPIEYLDGALKVLTNASQPFSPEEVEALQHSGDKRSGELEKLAEDRRKKAEEANKKAAKDKAEDKDDEPGKPQASSGASGAGAKK